MSRTVLIASLAAVVLAGSAFAADKSANLFTNSGFNGKSFTTTNTTALATTGASTMTVDVSKGGSGSNALFGNSASKMGASDIGKSAFSDLAGKANAKSNFAAASKTGVDFGK